MAARHGDFVAVKVENFGGQLAFLHHVLQARDIVEEGARDGPPCYLPVYRGAPRFHLPAGEALVWLVSVRVEQQQVEAVSDDGVYLAAQDERRVGVVALERGQRFARYELLAVEVRGTCGFVVHDARAGRIYFAEYALVLPDFVAGDVGHFVRADGVVDVRLPRGLGLIPKAFGAEAFAEPAVKILHDEV